MGCHTKSIKGISDDPSDDGCRPFDVRSRQRVAGRGRRRRCDDCGPSVACAFAAADYAATHGKPVNIPPSISPLRGQQGLISF